MLIRLLRIIGVISFIFSCYFPAHSQAEEASTHIQLVKDKKKDKKKKKNKKPAEHAHSHSSQYPPIYTDGYDNSRFGVNPFLIKMQPKQDVTIEDYIYIKNELEGIDIRSLVDRIVSEKNSSGLLIHKGHITERLTRPLANIIDINRNIYPEKHLVKIGNGGDRCIVCYASTNGPYPHYARAILPALERVNFNGYFLYYIGGWPNPTGEEILYCGVPYSFKIFAMVEAYSLGFTKVLWIDSACEPASDLMPLFDHIARHGAVIYHHGPDPIRDEILPRGTRAELFQLSGVDVLRARYVRGGILGLDMDTDLAKNFISVHYEYVKRGTPFLSCAPDEFVWTAILGRPQYQKWLDASTVFTDQRLLYGSDAPNAFVAAQQKGAFFVHRQGR
jgi:hypothetical protein